MQKLLLFLMVVCVAGAVLVKEGQNRQPVRQPVSMAMATVAEEPGDQLELSGTVDQLLHEESAVEFSLSVQTEEGYELYIVTNPLGKTLREGDAVVVTGTYQGAFDFAPVPWVMADRIFIQP